MKITSSRKATRAQSSYNLPVLGQCNGEEERESIVTAFQPSLRIVAQLRVMESALSTSQL
jgi:hypothetical protein